MQLLLYFKKQRIKSPISEQALYLHAQQVGVDVIPELYIAGTANGSLYSGPYYDVGGTCNGLFLTSGHLAGSEALRAHGESLTPEAAAASWRSGTDTVRFVFFQQLAAAAEQAGRVLEFMYALTEGPILFAVPDLAETLPVHISKGVMPNAAFVVTQVCVRRMEQAHAGRDVPVPANEAVAFLNKTAPVGTPGDGLSLPGEQLRLLQALLVRKEQIFVAR